jgi:hypothetical protein
VNMLQTMHFVDERATSYLNKIANAITIKTRIISRRRKMSTICSFPGVLVLLSDWTIAKMKVTHLHRRPLRPVRIRITQIIKSDWPA